MADSKFAREVARLTSSRERCEAGVDSFSKVPEAGRWTVYIYMDDEVTRQFSTVWYARRNVENRLDLFAIILCQLSNVRVLCLECCVKRIRAFNLKNNYRIEISKW